MSQAGRVCYKIAGRNAGMICVIVDKPEKGYAIIDGNIKRKKCNLKHLEPTERILEIKKGASTAEVHAAMKKAGLEVIKTKPKPKKERPKRQRKPKGTEKPAKEKKKE